MKVVFGLFNISLVIGMVSCCYVGTNMIGVTCDNKLVTRSRVDGNWHNADDECCISNVAVLPDNTLLGVYEGKLYTKKSPNIGKWEGPIESRGSDGKNVRVKDVAVMSDGRIVATTSEDKMVIRDDLISEWDKCEESQGIRAVDVYNDGRILGISKNGNLKRRKKVVNGAWEFFGGGGGKEMRDIAIQPNGTVFGIGKSTKGIYTLGDDDKWGDLHENSDCIISIVSCDNILPT
ncbi:uncharacterized protein LOC144432592 [Glandiceps talaboti]